MQSPGRRWSRCFFPREKNSEESLTEAVTEVGINQDSLEGSEGCGSERPPWFSCSWWEQSNDMQAVWEGCGGTACQRGTELSPRAAANRD